MTTSKFLHAATVAARKAVPFIRAGFYGKIRIQKKGGNYRSMVTDVDIGVQKIIEKILLQKFPGSQILGEETKFGHRTKNLLWIVDPIDGTTNFTQKIPYFATVIALMKNDQIELGMIYNPITNDIYRAESGKGAFHNNRRIHTSNTSSLNKAFGSLSWGKQHKHGSKLASTFINTAWKIRVNGSAALSMCEVASRKYDFFVSSGGDIHLWDIAAGTILVREAGGITTDQNRKPINFNLHFKEVVSAANKKLHSQLISFIQRRKV